MTLMNLLHDAGHVVLWVVVAFILNDSGRPVLAAAALALAFLSAMYASRNVVRRETIMRLKRVGRR